MKTVVESIMQQKLKLESDADQFKRLNQELRQTITRKGSDLKTIVDKVVSDSISDVQEEEQKYLLTKTDMECALKEAQKKAELSILKLTNAVENRDDSMLLNSNQSLHQIIRSMPQYTKYDMEWSIISLREGTLTKEMVKTMIGDVMISKKR